MSPKVPTLYSVLTTGANATEPAIYGTDTNAFVLDKDEIVEIILNNDDTGRYFEQQELSGVELTSLKESILSICTATTSKS